MRRCRGARVPTKPSLQHDSAATSCSWAVSERTRSGTRLSAGLVSEGIDTSHLAVDQDVATGLAIITVDDAGENSIVVSPGANGRVSSVDVDGAAAVLMAATVTLLQLEIPLDAVSAAAEASAGIVVLNAAPAAVAPGCSYSGDRCARRQPGRAAGTHRFR